MAKMIHVRPVNGARVLDPDAVPVPEALPAEGKMVEDKPFWRRRLKAKEVELVAASATTKTTKKNSKKKVADAATTTEQQAPVAEPEAIQEE